MQTTLFWPIKPQKFKTSISFRRSAVWTAWSWIWVRWVYDDRRQVGRWAEGAEVKGVGAVCRPSAAPRSVSPPHSDCATAPLTYLVWPMEPPPPPAYFTAKCTLSVALLALQRTCQTPVPPWRSEHFCIPGFTQPLCSVVFYPISNQLDSEYSEMWLTGELPMS